MALLLANMPEYLIVAVSSTRKNQQAVKQDHPTSDYVVVAVFE
jgi:hypothetical protein